MFGTTFTAILDAAGLLGAMLFVGAYAALQFGFLRGNGYVYTIANLAASSLVLLSLVGEFNLSSAIIQIIWIAVSVFGLVRMIVLERRARLNEEEREFIAAKFPTMDDPAARSFLNAGEWYEAEAGTRLATEGARLGALIYLASGEAEITVHGQVVAQCLSGSFIGEMSCFDGSAANATVTLQQHARYFLIRTEELQRLGRRDRDMRRMLDDGLGSDTRNKLIAANLLLHDTLRSSQI